ncbi:hypothetical protein [Sporosalibacterium faouarense]|uniref:hypothetical protein n=1 Tax=Sporosalibacterium faouarense TaxID=516123 RepID=UPI00141C988F|nr:hypothetical protein [Sporosalibacterium faouarense]MTI49350.1 hypothetical protein [Bacillota bacterium]
MRKKIVLLGILTIIIFAVIGCSNTTKDDLLNYTNDKLPRITNLEGEALDEYQSIISQDDYSYQILYSSLKDSIIPKYTQFVEKLEAISLNTEEVKSIHSLYVQGAKKQLEALTSLKEGIEEKSNEKIDKTGELLKESKELMNEYNDKVLKLADEVGVDYKLK